MACFNWAGSLKASLCNKASTCSDAPGIASPFKAAAKPKTRPAKMPAINDSSDTVAHAATRALLDDLVGDDAIMREGALDTKKNMTKLGSADELGPSTPGTY